MRFTSTVISIAAALTVSAAGLASPSPMPTMGPTPTAPPSPSYPTAPPLWTKSDFMAQHGSALRVGDEMLTITDNVTSVNVLTGKTLWSVRIPAPQGQIATACAPLLVSGSPVMRSGLLGLACSAAYPGGDANQREGFVSMVSVPERRVLWVNKQVGMWNTLMQSAEGEVLLTTAITGFAGAESLFAFDTITGKLTWTQVIAGSDGNPSIQTAMSQDKTVVVVVVKASVSAYNAKTGAKLWYNSVMPFMYTSVVTAPAQFPDQVLLVGHYGGEGVTSFNAKTGVQVWEHTMPASFWSIAIIDDAVMLGSGGSVAAFRLAPVNGSNHTVSFVPMWNFTAPKPAPGNCVMNVAPFSVNVVTIATCFHKFWAVNLATGAIQMEGMTEKFGGAGSFYPPVPTTAGGVGLGWVVVQGMSTYFAAFDTYGLKK